MKKRALGSGLPPLIDMASRERTAKGGVDAKESIDSISIDMEVVAVLRTKGGSGELHTVNRIAQEMGARGKTVLVIHSNHDTKYKHFYGLNPVTFECLDVSDSTATLFCPMWKMTRSQIQALESSKWDAIIFTLGLGSAATITQIDILSGRCNTINLSVCSRQFWSVEAALLLLEYFHGQGVSEKIRAYVWTRRGVRAYSLEIEEGGYGETKKKLQLLLD